MVKNIIEAAGTDGTCGTWPDAGPCGCALMEPPARGRAGVVARPVCDDGKKYDDDEDEEDEDVAGLDDVDDEDDAEADDDEFDDEDDDIFEDDDEDDDFDADVEEDEDDEF
ncbi:MAG: hypothetical protein ACK4WH_07070 [Phycisphaerales bacterium]